VHPGAEVPVKLVAAALQQTGESASLLL
jgi:hypothetical protein